MITFLFDQNLPLNLAHGLATLEKSNYKSPNACKIYHTIDLEFSNYTDEALIVEAAKLNAVIITEDKDFKHFKHYKELYLQHNVSAVKYTLSNRKNERYWDRVIAFVTQWEEIKLRIANTESNIIIEFNHKGCSTFTI